MLRRCLAVLIPLCLFGLVFGVKLDVVHRYGSDLPRWDQWDPKDQQAVLDLCAARMERYGYRTTQTPTPTATTPTPTSVTTATVATPEPATTPQPARAGA